MRACLGLTRRMHIDFRFFFLCWDNVAESRWANVKLATNEFLNREAIYFGRFDVILSC